MDDINFREVLTRKPFTRALPTGYLNHAVITDGRSIGEPKDLLTYQIVTQADFIREYDPSGHAINSPEFYPDIIKKDPESGKYFREPVVRCSFAFQRIIATKHIIHLCGNDIQFELPDSEDNEESKKMMLKFKKGWVDKNMEIKFYEAIESLKVTGDFALVGYFNKGNFGVKRLSYLDKDTLYPHFDSLTDELTLFARKYYDYDEEGKQVTEWVEVWDEKYLYRYKSGVGEGKPMIQRIKEAFGLSGYQLVSKKLHGFPFIPVAYYRDDRGACWSNSQDSIDKYELAFSQLSQNNQAFAFPIMYLKGDEVELISNDMDSAVKVITMGQDDEAGFLQKQDASDSFAAQLDKLYKMIYEQSFAVIPPELKSGDLPGVAVKLLYSPAYENAMRDAQDLNPFLDKMITIFKYGYGWEMGEFSQFMRFKVYGWIEPYYHKSAAELVTNLATAVQNGFLSRQTATERCPDYPKNGEIDRIVREDIEKRQLDLKYTLEQKQKESEIKVEEERMKAKYKVSTGNGNKSGRPNESGKKWDDQNNYEGRNGWEDWNKKH